MSKIDLEPRAMLKKLRYKICIFGDAGVGKTTLINRYMTGVFKEKYVITIGMEFYLKKLIINDYEVSLQIWDFAGEDKFRFLMPSAITGANGALFMYDITRYNTLESLSSWFETFEETIKKEGGKVPVILVGAKSDLQEYRAVPQDDVVRLAKDHNISQIIECSSKRGENVEETFELLAKLIMKMNKVK